MGAILTRLISERARCYDLAAWNNVLGWEREAFFAFYCWPGWGVIGRGERRRRGWEEDLRRLEISGRKKSSFSTATRVRRIKMGKTAYWQI